MAEVDMKKICERVLEDYIDNCTLRSMTDEEKGYHKCLTDIMTGKFE